MHNVSKRIGNDETYFTAKSEKYNADVGFINPVFGLNTPTIKETIFNLEQDRGENEKNLVILQEKKRDIVKKIEETKAFYNDSVKQLLSTNRESENQHIQNLLKQKEELEDLQAEIDALISKCSILNAQYNKSIKHFENIVNENKLNVNKIIDIKKDAATLLEQEKAEIEQKIKEVIKQIEDNNEKLEKLSTDLDHNISLNPLNHHYYSPYSLSVGDTVEASGNETFLKRLADKLTGYGLVGSQLEGGRMSFKPNLDSSWGIKEQIEIASDAANKYSKNSTPSL